MITDSPAYRLKIARKAAGYKTAKSFSEQNCIPQSTYSLHELGKRHLKLETAKKYAILLGIHLKWLMIGEEGAAGEKELAAAKKFLTAQEFKIYAGESSKTTEIFLAHHDSDYELLRYIISAILSLNNSFNNPLSNDEIAGAVIDIHQQASTFSGDLEDKKRFIQTLLKYIKLGNKQRKTAI